jgi:hypothetical protein
MDKNECTGWRGALYLMELVGTSGAKPAWVIYA